MEYENRDNDRMTVLSVIGTRPEAIKMAPLLRQLEKHPLLQSRICVTGQHRDLLDQVLELFEIRPHHDLNVMKSNQGLSYVTQEVLIGIDKILMDERPDWVIVQGDTTTALAASLAAFHRGVKVGHVEAGLRSNNKHHPFPEEINRRIADVLADLHFAPTPLARENLLSEGFSEKDIVLTGNTIVDALHFLLSTREELSETDKNGTSVNDVRIVLVTAHRRENFGEPIRQICKALLGLTDLYGHSLQIVYPVHPNPNIRRPVYDLLDGVEGITLLEPLNYADFVSLMSRSYIILSDSGGIQEEATVMGKPVLIMRETTERSEAISAGNAKLVGTNASRIIAEARQLLDDNDCHKEMSQVSTVFGDGKASGYIIDALLNRS